MTGKAVCWAALGLIAAGCTRHEVAVAPVEVKPIRITIDVNVKVDRALDEFFDDLDQAATTPAGGPSHEEP
ncbi:MAG: hypothetical protein AB1634_18890 [Thermodesulfobacteriota bacterium]